MRPTDAGGPGWTARPGAGPAGSAVGAPPGPTDRFGPARAVADAVLYEGYILYPYRSSAAKNQSRWQFGVVVPPDYAALGTGDHAEQQTECVVEPGPGAVLQVRLRFLQLQMRRVEVPARAGRGFRAVDRLVVDGEPWLPFDEAVPREIAVDVTVDTLLNAALDQPVTAPAGCDREPLADRSGRLAGRLVRERWPLHGVLRLDARPALDSWGAYRLRARLENHARPAGPLPDRAAALRHSFIAAHLLLGVSAGGFVSLLDPPEWARTVAAECVNLHTWPVLVGEPGSQDAMLSSPIILYDHPRIAPESPGDLFDATEIDELLVLRTLTLTDVEKREARATDQRAAAIIDRAEHMPPELLDRLHGAVRSLGPAAPGLRHREPDGPQVVQPSGAAAGRTVPGEVPWWDPGVDAAVSPETDALLIGGVAVSRGSRVALRPAEHGADAQDMFLTGRTARVEAVFHDVDGRSHLAVTLEDEPVADLHRAHGRYLYFAPDEIEPLGVTG